MGAGFWLLLGVATTDRAISVAISESILYLADAWSGIQVIDIHDPESPQLLGNSYTSNSAMDLAVFGNNVFVASYRAGLKVLPIQCDVHVGIDEDYYDIEPEPTDIPLAVVDLSVHPNPFNPRTTVSFSIGHFQTVELCIFDMTGKRIAVLADREFQAGAYSMDWLGRDLQGRAVASGTYLLRMVTEERVTSQKMMLIR